MRANASMPGELSGTATKRTDSQRGQPALRPNMRNDINPSFEMAAGLALQRNKHSLLNITIH
ncbi:hypothetical protein thsrh120_48410 [Rhizobium sp. No.120]